MSGSYNDTMSVLLCLSCIVDGLDNISTVNIMKS